MNIFEVYGKEERINEVGIMSGMFYFLIPFYVFICFFANIGKLRNAGNLMVLSIISVTLLGVGGLIAIISFIIMTPFLLYGLLYVFSNIVGSCLIQFLTPFRLLSMSMSTTLVLP